MHIERWTRGADGHWSRVARNIAGETALVHVDFVRLLQSFAAELHQGVAPVPAWQCACRKSQLVGAPLPDDRTPEIVGRALNLGDYARMISASSALTEGQAKELLHEVILAGRNPPRRLARVLQRAPVGRYVVWATFDPQWPDEHPYGRMMRTTHFVRTAFGLGHCRPTDILALIAYRARSRGLELRRPTVADAESYAGYRPCERHELHGWTEPLPLNRRRLPRQPEVVHAEVSGEGLVFPVYSTR